MDETLLDIFRGTSDKDAVWFEAVAGFVFARERMEELAALNPGQYFVFPQACGSIFVRIDTRTSASPAAKAETA